MELRCKVFRAATAGELEEAVNRFLAEELPPLGPAQFEEITQSESVAGVTVILWYTLVAAESQSLDETEYEELDEVDDGRELA
jgi:hypothetical protein